MTLPTEDIVLYSIIAFIVIENIIEIYLSLRQVSKKLIIFRVTIEKAAHVIQETIAINLS